MKYQILYITYAEYQIHSSLKLYPTKLWIWLYFIDLENCSGDLAPPIAAAGLYRCGIWRYGQMHKKWEFGVQ